MLFEHLASCKDTTFSVNSPLFYIYYKRTELKNISCPMLIS